MGKLTREQLAEVKSYLDAGKDLPDDFKHVLFPPEKAEYELIYSGKERVEDIIADTWSVPLQPVRTFNLSKGKQAPGRRWSWDDRSSAANTRSSTRRCSHCGRDWAVISPRIRKLPCCSGP